MKHFFRINWNNFSLNIESKHFTLLLPEKEGSEPILLPIINLNWQPNFILLGGKFNLNFNSRATQSLYRHFQSTLSNCWTKLMWFCNSKVQNYIEPAYSIICHNIPNYEI